MVKWLLLQVWMGKKRSLPQPPLPEIQMFIRSLLRVHCTLRGRKGGEKIKVNKLTRKNTSIGGCSGIGLAAARIFASRGAKVHALDLNSIDKISDNDSKDCGGEQRIVYTHCDVTDWARLRQIFTEIGHVDIAVANAGVSQECDYFADTFDADGKLEEPHYAVLDVNYRAVLNFIKLSLSAFRKQGCAGGSIVITSSAAAYAPEQSLPVYSATKTAVRSIVFPSFLA